MLRYTLVSKAYTSAKNVRFVDPNAFAVLAGRTLEFVCEHEQAQGKVLADKLKYLADSGRIPQILARMCQQLRMLRNLGAHANEDEVKQDDVPYILDFVTTILEYLYVAPTKVARLEERLARKPKKVEEHPITDEKRYSRRIAKIEAKFRELLHKDIKFSFEDDPFWL